MNQIKAEETAELFRRKILGGRITQTRLSKKEKGYFAKILVEDYKKKRYAVFVKVTSEEIGPEKMMAKALLWFYELEKRSGEKRSELWLAAEKETAEKLWLLLKSFNLQWQKKIKVFEISKKDLTEVISISGKEKKSIYRKLDKTSEKAKEIKNFLGEEVDLTSRKNKENFSFRGLSFAYLIKDEIWIGVEEAKNPDSLENLREKAEKIRLYRQFESPNKKHLYYRLFPESWLESVIRREIKSLDKNLRLAPVYNQFQSSEKKIDILAIREDNRLVIIELKVFPNCEHLFQAVSYWQEVEKNRKSGKLNRFFRQNLASTKPAIIYLVGPKSCFHHDFYFLAGIISPEIEIYRFDLHEKWREKIKVLERKKV